MRDLFRGHDRLCPGRGPCRTRHGGRRVAQTKAAEREQRRHTLLDPRCGFRVVVPRRFPSWGEPPPAWCIDNRMRHEGHPGVAKARPARRRADTGISPPELGAARDARCRDDRQHRGRAGRSGHGACVRNSGGAGAAFACAAVRRPGYLLEYVTPAESVRSARPLCTPVRRIRNR